MNHFALKDVKPVIYALIAVLSWSTVATAFKITLRYLSHFEMVLLASATAMVVFAFVLTIQRKWGIVRRLEPRKWGYFALLGLLNPVAYYLVLFAAYDMLPAQVAQPINYTWPIVLLVLLALFSGQKIYKWKFLGMVISLIGVCFISFGKADSGTALSLSGILLGFLSAFLWALFWLVNNRNKDLTDGNVALFMSFLFGTIYLAVAALFIGVDYSSLPGVLAGIYVGCFEMGVPFVFFALALRTTTNPALVNQMSYLSPFLSLFLIAVFLGETIAVTTIIGLVLIVLGIVLNEFVFTGKAKVN